MKMVVAWHDAAFTTPELVLTPEMMDRILEKFKLQHRLKDTWTRSEALLYEKMIDLDESMAGKNSPSTGHNSEAESLLESIDDQRMKLKDMREADDETKTKI